MSNNFALSAIVVAIALAASLCTIEAQKVHVVGDNLGWIVPPGGSIAYSTWADLQTFSVGDILLFNFKTGEQNVARVTKEAFDACNSANPISLQTTGPANYSLSSNGEYYFISTLDRHCFFGQKLAINVTRASSGPSASPAPVPPRAPVTYIVGDDLGWIVPPGGKIAYETWAYDKIFTVGDSLVFNFTTGEQDVARVTKEAFDTCNSTNPLSLQTTGPASYTLTSTGEYYFISTLDRHCFFGQKLAINVTRGSSGPPSASPTPLAPKASPVPPAPRAPVTYVVGDDLGWIVPPGGKIAYETWAYDKIFAVGDTLVFKFTTGEQDVARVTKKAFDTCNSTNPLSLQTAGPVSYTLTSTGEYYFISTLDRHCFFGQKLAINVTRGSSGPPSASPTPLAPKASPVPAAPRAPVTYIVGDDLGWLVPPGGPIAYETWAYRKTFAVRDILVFNFENGTQDVAEVTKSAYNSCDTSNPIRVISTSPARITLTSAGEHFYTSTYSRHCNLGQKLAINVIDYGTAPYPSIAEPPSDALSPAGGPNGAPAPFSSASRHAALGFFASLAIAFTALLVF